MSRFGDSSLQLRCNESCLLSPATMQRLRFQSWPWFGISDTRITGSVSTFRILIQLQRTLARISSARSEEHTSELQSLLRISYAFFCLQKINSNPHTYLIPLMSTIDLQI